MDHVEVFSSGSAPLLPQFLNRLLAVLHGDGQRNQQFQKVTADGVIVPAHLLAASVVPELRWLRGSLPAHHVTLPQQRPRLEHDSDSRRVCPNKKGVARLASKHLDAERERCEILTEYFNTQAPAVDLVQNDFDNFKDWRIAKIIEKERAAAEKKGEE